jgi:hypothetical protein
MNMRTDKTHKLLGSLGQTPIFSPHQIPMAVQRKTGNVQHLNTIVRLSRQAMGRYHS